MEVTTNQAINQVNLSLIWVAFTLLVISNLHLIANRSVLFKTCAAIIATPTIVFATASTTALIYQGLVNNIVATSDPYYIGAATAVVAQVLIAAALYIAMRWTFRKLARSQPGATAGQSQ